MPSKAKSLLQKIKRRTWMKFALRGVGGNDNFERLDLAYSIEDPWNMDSPGERARFEATNRIIEREFGPLDSLLELGCGEGHQTLHFASLARQTYGLDVSERPSSVPASAYPQENLPQPTSFPSPGSMPVRAWIWSPPAKCSTTSRMSKPRSSACRSLGATAWSPSLRQPHVAWARTWSVFPA